jgi:thymidylate synthase (FAD)
MSNDVPQNNGYSTVGYTVPVLDAGWVRLTDVMGSDLAVVRRARRSYGEPEFRGWDKEIGLLDTLMRYNHKSVFQAGRMVIAAQLPIETIREADRHRTLDMHGDTSLDGDAGSPLILYSVDPTMRKFINKNEASGRYVDITQFPCRLQEYERIRGKGKTNKQGSEGEISHEDKLWFMENEKRIKEDAVGFIREALDRGISYEVARDVMPLGHYTIIELDGDCLWWMEFFRLRLAPGAKEEIRKFAAVCYEFFKALFPKMAELFEEHQLYSTKFSRTETQILKELVGHALLSITSDRGKYLRDLGAAKGLKGGALGEFVAKLS